MSHRLLRWLAVTLLLAGPVSAAPADPEAVRRVLGDSGAAPMSPTSADIARVLDAVARQETTGLGKGNPEWKPTNPRWAGVYAQVRADLEAEAPQLGADLTAAGRRSSDRLVNAVAAQMSPSETDAILAYYDTAEGKRYVALMARLDKLLPQGLGQAAAGKPPPPPPPEALSEDRQQQLLEFLSLSRAMQSAMAAQPLAAAMHADISGFSGVAMIMAASLRFNQDEVVALYTQYQPDIRAFSDFEKTPAAQSLFQALGRATFLSQQGPVAPITEVLAGVEQRHRTGWQELYRQSVP